MQRKNKKDLSTSLKLATLATKVELKEEQDKIIKLQTYNLSYFLGKHMFAYQPALNTLEFLTLREH